MEERPLTVIDSQLMVSNSSLIASLYLFKWPLLLFSVSSGVSYTFWRESKAVANL